MRHLASLLLASTLALGCAAETSPPTEAVFELGDGASAARSGPDAATMEYGNPDAGSPFPPPSGHDASNHGRDKINPRTLVVDAGTTVRFVVNPTHRVVIYDDGTQPEDIEVSPATLVTLGGIPNFGIDDPDDRLVIQPAAAFSFGAPSTFSYTFTEPGRYLVICGVAPHFVGFNMYGWVEVK